MSLITYRLWQTPSDLNHPVNSERTDTTNVRAGAQQDGPGGRGRVSRLDCAFQLTQWRLLGANRRAERKRQLLQSFRMDRPIHQLGIASSLSLTFDPVSHAIPFTRCVSKTGQRGSKVQ